MTLTTEPSVSKETIRSNFQRLTKSSEDSTFYDHALEQKAHVINFIKENFVVTDVGNGRFLLDKVEFVKVNSTKETYKNLIEYISYTELKEEHEHERLFFLRSMPSLEQVEGKFLKEDFTFLDKKFSAGTKTSKLITHIKEVFRHKTEYPMLDSYFDDLNAHLKNATFFMTVNPLDFLFMSVGKSWSSCFNLYEGGYRSATVYHAQDLNSFLTIALSEKETESFLQGREYELLMRQLNHVTEISTSSSEGYEGMVSSLPYPSLDSTAFTDILTEKCKNSEWDFIRTNYFSADYEGRKPPYSDILSDDEMLLARHKNSRHGMKVINNLYPKQDYLCPSCMKQFNPNHCEDYLLCYSCLSRLSRY